MDELYGNAWGDSADIAGDLPLPRPSWTSPVLTTHEQEADLAAPSWSTGTGVQWDEPSEEVHGLGWSTSPHDETWRTNSVYDDIPIQSSTSERRSDQVSVTSAPHSEDIDVTHEVEPEYQQESTKTAHSTPHPDIPFASDLEAETLSPSSPSFSRSSSPDGFGTFETAFEKDSNTIPAALEDESWGSPWVGSVKAEEPDKAHPVDEWEAARKRKEDLDRRIPPEVLNGLLVQCTEFFEEAAGDPSAPKTKGGDDAWANQWRQGMGSIEGLQSLVQSIVPDLTLQPSSNFAKTSIAKSMASAVKVTKNLPLSRNSPLSHYFATKGSTAWETALRERKEMPDEDVVPAGWRILEKQPTSDSSDMTKQAKQGGFFSFWGRKHSKTPSLPSEVPSQPSTPHISSSNTPIIEHGEVSSKSSMDIGQTQTSSKEKAESPTRSGSPASFVAAPKDITVPERVPTPSTYADAPDLPDNSTQPPSTVSRFLSRFSRSRSSVGSSSPRNSLALSSDDLDLLSDIVPSAQDTEDADGKAHDNLLNNVLKPEPLPPALPPPPISTARAPVMARAPAFISGGSLSKKLVPPAQASNNDLDDLFGAFQSPGHSPDVPSSSASTGQSFDTFGILSPTSAVIQRSMTPVSTGASAIQAIRSGSPAPLSFDEGLPTTIKAPVQSLPSRPSSVTPRAGPVDASSSDDAGLRNRPHTKPLQPKIPLSFTIPPPPTDVSLTPPLSASEIPLAQLYLNAISKKGIIPGPNDSRASSPFRLDPAPQPRNFNPIVVDRPISPPKAAPLLPPPPTFGRSTTTEPPISNVFDDDDDFADFQSPSESVPPLQSTFPPPPAFKLASPPKPIPPSFTTLNLAVSTPSSAQPLSSDALDDEFSSFFSSSSSTNLRPQSSQSTELDSSFSFNSSQSLHSRQFGLNDFASSPSSSALRTPSPPRPLSKAVKPSLSILPPPSTANTSKPTMSEEKKSQHARTMTLMERAAARPGRWPAPPSPLPQALSFPLSGSSTQNFDLMEEDDSFGTFSDSPTVPQSSSNFSLLTPAGVTTSKSPDTLFPPLFGNVSEPSFKESAPVRPNTGKQGLSAQDLSFFEGL